MKIINTLVAALFVSLSLASYSGVAAETGKKHHVVFHITDNDPAKWNQVINNAGNLQKAVGKDNIEIEVVANGPGLEMFRMETQVGEQMSESLKNGVEYKACATTMKAMKVTESDLLPGVTTVPGGVIEIMTKQEAGWTYLKI